MRPCVSCGVAFSGRGTRACSDCAPPGTRWCSPCQRVLALDCFYASARGHCRECTKAKAARWHRDNQERHRASSQRWREQNPERFIETQRKSRTKHQAKNLAKAKLPQNRAARLLGAANKRGRDSGVPTFVSVDFTRDLQRRIDAGVCEVTGIGFSFEPNGLGPRNPFTPSLDRIAPSLGYVPGNVRVVCWAVNAMVGEWGDDVAAQVAEAFLAKRAERMAAAGLSSPPPPRTFRPSPVTTLALPPLEPLVHAHPSAFPEAFVPC
jgi:hypothetical protein